VDFLVNPDTAPGLAAHGAVIGGVRLLCLDLFAGLAVHSFGCLWIERFGQMCLPVQVRAGRAQFPVSLGSAFQAPSDIACVGCDFCRYDAGPDIIRIGQTQVLVPPIADVI